MTYDIDRFVYADEELTDRLSASITLNGTIDSVNAYDNDFNYVITQAIDLTKFGIKTNNDYYFEYGFSEEDMIPVHVVVADGVATITGVELSEDTVTAVQCEDCYTSTILARPVLSQDGTALFYGDLTIEPAEHKFVETDKHGVLKCEVCGAVYTDSALAFATGALDGAVEKGLTIPFEYVTAGTNDLSIIPVKPTSSNLIIRRRSVDPWNSPPTRLAGRVLHAAQHLTHTHSHPSMATGP